MIIDSGLPEDLWLEAIYTTIHVTNLIVIRSIGLTPYRAILDIEDDLRTVPPLISYLRYFRVLYYVNIPYENRVKSEKFKPRALRGYLVRY